MFYLSQVEVHYSLSLSKLLLKFLFKGSASRRDADWSNDGSPKDGGKNMFMSKFDEKKILEKINIYMKKISHFLLLILSLSRV